MIILEVAALGIVATATESSRKKDLGAAATEDDSTMVAETRGGKARGKFVLKTV
jgi:muramoyltetrapeptide carboxypeptidase LdcA involved in peptidoglycan recycling